MITEFRKEYNWLSNFANVKIILDDIVYQSVEHAYMSEKSDDVEWKLFCSNINNSASVVKAESKKIIIKHNWDKIKLDVMEKCLIQKYNTEPYKTKLLETKNIYIQEGNNWNDKFWGVCLKTNKGKNHLGKLIMYIRYNLQNNINFVIS